MKDIQTSEILMPILKYIPDVESFYVLWEIQSYVFNIEFPIFLLILG